jgi:hypothetical protein
MGSPAAASTSLTAPTIQPRLTHFAFGELGGAKSRVHDVNFFENLVVVLASGLLAFEMVNLSAGEKHVLLSTDEFVNYMLTEQKRQRTGEPETGVLVRRIVEDRGAETFGRFFVYLLIALERMRLGVADLGRYLDPDMPMAIRRES